MTFEMLAVVRKTVIQGIKIGHLSVGLAVVVLLFALPILFNPKGFRAAMKEFVDNSSTVRVAGLVILVVAFLILNTRRGLTFNSPMVIMAIIGYLAIIKGAIFIWFPKFVQEYTAKLFRKDLYLYLCGVIALLFAVALIYLGCWVY